MNRAINLARNKSKRKKIHLPVIKITKSISEHKVLEEKNPFINPKMNLANRYKIENRNPNKIKNPSFYLSNRKILKLRQTINLSKRALLLGGNGLKGARRLSLMKLKAPPRIHQHLRLMRLLHSLKQN